MSLFHPDAETALRYRAKAELRKRMRALRNTIPESARAERSAKIVERVAALPEFSAASTVALFSPMLERCEVDVRPLDALARAAQKRIVYPCFVEHGESFEPALRLATLAEMQDRGHHCPEPPEDAPLLDSPAGLLLVVPALAVGASGHRIGYGRGFYDALLAKVVPPAFAVAVAFDFQLLAEIPVTEGDAACGAVVTDGRTIRV